MREKKSKKSIIIKATVIVAILLLTLLICKAFNVFTADNILSITPKNQLLAVIVLLIFYALNSLSIFFPIAVLYAAVGMIFSLPLALLVNFLGALLCTVLPYIIGKFKGQEYVDALTKRYPKLKSIFEIEKGNDWFLSYFLRVINLLPMDLVSMFLGAANVDTAKYMTGSMLGNLPGIIAITVVGQSITDPTSPTFIISLSITVFISVLSVIIFRIYKKRKLEKIN